MRVRPANSTGTMVVKGIAPHTASLVNPICAARFRRDYVYVAGSRPYSPGNIEGPLLLYWCLNRYWLFGVVYMTRPSFDKMVKKNSELCLASNRQKKLHLLVVVLRPRPTNSSMQCCAISSYTSAMPARLCTRGKDKRMSTTFLLGCASEL